MRVFPSGVSFDAALYFLISFIVLISIIAGDEIQYSQRLPVVCNFCFFLNHVSVLKSPYACFVFPLLDSAYVVFWINILKKPLSDCWLTYLVIAVDGQQESLKRKGNKLPFIGLGEWLLVWLTTCFIMNSDSLCSVAGKSNGRNSKKISSSHT